MSSPNLPPGAARVLFENSTDAVLLASADGGIIAANPAACALFGMSEAELRSRGIDDLITEAPSPASFAAQERSAEASRPLTCRRKDGSTFAGELCSVALDEGERYIAIVRKIFERQQADEVLEGIGDGFFALDGDWRFVYVNAMAERLLDIRREEVLGRSHWEVFPLTLGTRIETEYRRAAAGEIRDWENYYEPWGRWFHNRCYPREGGGMTVYFLDITERKRREEELRRAHALIEGITVGTEDMIAAEDGEFRYLFFNEAYRREFKALWGKEIEVGTSMLEALSPWPEEQRKARKLWSRALAGETFSIRMEFGPTEGDRQVYDLRFNPVYDERGEQLGAAHILRNVTETVRMEQALHRSEDRYRTLFTTMTEGFAVGEPILDEEGRPIDFRLLEINDAFERQSGLSKGVLGQPVSAVLPNLESVWTETYCRVALGGEPVRFEQFNRDTGRWYDVYCYRPAEGRFAILFRDVTENRRMQETLRKREERFRDLADNISQFAWMADSSGWIFWYNKRWYDYTGTSLEEMRGWGWRKVHHPDHVDRVVKKISRSYETGEPWEDVFPLRGRDGQYRWFLSRALPIRDAEGNILRWFGTNTDITEQREAEEALRASEEKFRAVFEQAAVGIGRVRFDDARWIDVNEAFCRMVGYSRKEILATPWPQITHPDDLDLDLVPFRRMAAGELESYSVEKRYIHKAGHHVWARLALSLVRDSQGRPDYEIAVIENVTERREAEEALKEAKAAAEEASRAKSEFLANMSHEIRTPMTVFMSAVEQLLHIDGNPERRHLLKLADQSAARLRTLIDDILDFSRIEARKVEIEEEPFDVRSCVQEVLEMFTLPAQEKNLRLEAEVSAETPRVVVGDCDRLAQVLINLIGNAVKFTDAGEVRVCVRPLGDRLEFSVADTGIGIPEDKPHLLFESFSQVDSSFHRRYGGSGLGLAISKGLVELMGGEISARNRRGEGSVFTFTLPQKTGIREPSAPAEGIPEGPGEPAGLRILIAEDDPMIQELIALMLKKRGLQVETAGSGRIALEKWEEGAFDLVLMDLQMPEMDGMEATRAIRSQESEKDRRTCIIGLTAHTRKEIKEQCLDSGMNLVLVKPVQMSELFSAIDQCLAE